MNSAARSAGAVVVTEDMIFGAVTLVILSPRPPSSRERQMATANEPHPAVDQIRLREDLVILMTGTRPLNAHPGVPAHRAVHRPRIDHAALPGEGLIRTEEHPTGTIFRTA
jgi:hypothetical protein